MSARKLEFPRVYPITDRTISGLSDHEQVEAFIDGGARLIQVRDKNSSSRDFFDWIRDCLEITRKNNAKLIVNDRADIALLLKADGVHLGQDDLPPAEARKLLSDEAIIGFSTHNLEQVRKALEMPIDYLAFGPIFPTGTKVDHDPVVGLEMLKRVRDAVKDLPLVAIGGIHLENLGSVLEAGADSAAMISALLVSADRIGENTKRAFNLSSDGS
jgi:thiamine-phosphate pyrophosphorylase